MKVEITKKVLRLTGLYTLQSDKRFDYAPPETGKETHIQLHFTEYEYVDCAYRPTGHSWECIVTITELFNALRQHITKNTMEGEF